MSIAAVVLERRRPPARPGFVSGVLQLRQIIVTRVRTEGTPGQQAKLAPFLRRLQAADAGVH